MLSLLRIAHAIAAMPSSLLISFLLSPQIHKDGLSIAKYVARTLDGVAQNSHLRSDNYFYYNCLTGRCVFLRAASLAERSQTTGCRTCPNASSISSLLCSP